MMANSTFAYTTYIRTTPEKLWEALTSPEFQRQYWFDMRLESDWNVGSPWTMLSPGDEATDEGEVLESDPPKKLVLRWRNLDVASEGDSICTISLEPVSDSVKLSILHEMEKDKSVVIERVGWGWPLILSNLKSVVENGGVALATLPQRG
jgi:uncharacterized protein YndB with AHSA1/START domain